MLYTVKKYKFILSSVFLGGYELKSCVQCNYTLLNTHTQVEGCELMDEGTHLHEVVTQAMQTAAQPTQLPADAESSIHKIRLVSADTAFEVC